MVQPNILKQAKAVGGHNACSGCASDARRFWDLAYTFRAKHLTLKDRKDIVLAGSAGRQ